MQRRLITLFAVAALALGLAACGSSSKSSSSSSGSAQITINGFSFSPTPVKAGSTVTVKNDSTTKHTVTADGGQFNVSIDGGQTATFTAPNKPGTYAFHCTIHPFMKATLTVN
jgi:plastocyanin